MKCVECVDYAECSKKNNLTIKRKYCPMAKVVYVQTNADRIRAMSDDGLAEFIILSPEMEFDVCSLCQFGNPTPMDDRGICLSGYGACDAESRAEAFKKWLKQPAETTNADRCVCCGAIIPEGQMVCPNCLVTIKEDN